MLRAHLVEGADDGALQQAPDALRRIRMHRAPYPFLLTVVDRLMARVRIAQALVACPLIGIDGGSGRRDTLTDDGVESLTLSVRDNFEANIPATLDDASGDALVLGVAKPLPVHLAADVGFVHLYGAVRCR